MPVLKKTSLFRFMQEDEMPVIKSWRKLDKEVDEFVFIWSRWKKWLTEPPIVAVVDRKVVGYHGLSFTKSGYTNSISQFVLPEFRGRGLAVGMIDKLLRSSIAEGMNRLRFRCPIGDGAGVSLWNGYFGIEPIGTAEGDLWFDISLDGITSADDLKKFGYSTHLPPTADKRRLAYYRRVKLSSTIKEYQCLL